MKNTKNSNKMIIKLLNNGEDPEEYLKKYASFNEITESASLYNQQYLLLDINTTKPMYVYRSFNNINRFYATYTNEFTGLIGIDLDSILITDHLQDDLIMDEFFNGIKKQSKNSKIILFLHKTDLYAKEQKNKMLIERLKKNFPTIKSSICDSKTKRSKLL